MKGPESNRAYTTGETRIQLLSELQATALIATGQGEEVRSITGPLHRRNLVAKKFEKETA